MSVEVIVAGGGPVGLLTAALLDAAGITVEVLERRTGRSEQARATTMHPRTLEVLTLLRTEDDRRLSDILVSLGRPEPKAHFAVLPDLLDYAQLDTPYPFVLMVPQTTTERVLAAHLRLRGIAVHYGHDVSGFAQDADGVEVTVNGGVRRAGYLVGADGAHSLVRRHAGIDFPGTPPSMVGFVADVTLTDPPDGAAHYWDHRHGQLSFLPFPEGAYGLSDGSAYRVFGTEAADTRLTSDEVRARQARSLTLDELRAILRRMTGSDHGLRDGLWLSTANDTTRHAVKYRANRIFLAGDAAHVHLPAGGQGLNVGLQDAANLAWKLAAEIHGWAPPLITGGAAGYESERAPVAAGLAGNTLAQAALMTTFTPAGAALRDLMSALIAKGGDTADDLTAWLSGLGLSYPPPFSGHPLDGCRAPDLELSDGTLHRRLAVDRFLLADFTPDAVFTPLRSARVEVAQALPWSGLSAALVRPDGYIARAWTAPGIEEVAAALRSWTTPAPAPTHLSP
ncbi:MULTISPECIES: FAD-dependent monooxygenase [unclassified Streptomyces]|uniref:FAD-dependent monooxygenase n=1 Tax=unclassified Streptomyces TaxID=2593676 RepID=UPI0008813276|nr:MULTISPECIES: FAD-dependent monooxygenase [unclassified Streptomyces]SDQ67952.1 2-polyprenyl-6-methoxyphenol hydroxylase [Streptomyces sp. KS_16]SEE13562.1 2-polyprenyl-6-methoxyphenol hydroxylase [Streptomyces sp. 2133.1]SNC74095.1 2-polyprenyl-6-methoxyphenol hydroxylase [Streptomyces sp. 2114.4]